MSIPLPRVIADHLPGRSFTSAVEAAEAYARSGGPMLFAWMHSPRPVAQRACIRAGVEYALIRATDCLATARMAHGFFVAQRKLDIAAHHRRNAAHWIEMARFYRAVLAELAEDRSAGVTPIFPEANTKEAA